MAAKKNIIKDLKQEIRDLNDKLEGQRQHMTYRERQFLRVMKDHEIEIAMINSQTNNIANTLKFRFTKELTWMTLCDNPDNKLEYIRHAIEILSGICAPIHKANNE